ncbi:MAG: class I SAM-dependent methyltransferase [Oscillospiraceae bacterium]|nr:class I SAM-dependent methyltransferase [Oscillospiraceae bacterium]
MNWYAEEYHEIQLKHQFVYGQQLIFRLLEFIDLSSKTILDIGCGEGSLTNILSNHAGKNGKVIGIDKDESMIACANRQYGHIDFIKADVLEWLSNFNEKTDIIFSNAMLHWLGTYDALELFFGLCAKAMSDKSYVACRFSLKENAWEAKRFLQSHLQRYLGDSSIVVGKPEYEHDRVVDMIETTFDIVYQKLFHEQPFCDDKSMNFDWMVKSQPITQYFEKKGDFERFVAYLRERWMETPVEVSSSQCEFIFKLKKFI